MTAIVVLIVLVALALAAQRYGADARSGDGVWAGGAGPRPEDGPQDRARFRDDLHVVGRAVSRLTHSSAV
jgi:hypothetical protein